ncbi:MAG TPA: PilZ domain-containing protein [Chthoniobacteraceae bacterium]|nr:PilZ domain-containing protein [Chthoniobacteraceae bacterium]
MSPSFYLDYGVDAQHGACGTVEISERGMRFESRWQFSIGTQLSIALQHVHPRLGLSRVTVEGIVVWCEPTAGKRYESTLLFLELPDELRPCLREFSHLVGANG